MTLLSQFEKPDKVSWEKLISKALKINNLNEFESKEVAGVKINPFPYPTEIDSHKSPLQIQNAAWIMGMSFDFPQNQLNEVLLNFLRNGGESLDLQLAEDTNWKQIYEGVHAQMIYQDLSFASNPVKGIEQFHDYLEDKKYKPNSLRGAVNFKPMELIQNQKWASNFGQFHFLTATSIAKNNIQCLSSLLTQLNGFLNLVEAGHLKINQIKAKLRMEYHLPVNVAKVRSMRMLWANLLSARNIPFSPLFVHTSTVLDPQLDDDSMLIANTNAVVNAALGTSDLIDVLHCSKDWPRARIHLNIQHILQLESRIHTVKDPLAGSYAIEELSSQMAEKSWEHFQKSGI